MSCNNWRMAASLGTLPTNFLSSHRLPKPTAIAYRSWTEQFDVGEGATAEHGYINVQIVWGVLERAQLATLKDIIAAAGVNRLYMTIDKNYGDRGVEEWIDVSGYPRMSPPSPSVPVDRSTYSVFDSFTLTLNNVTVINDPATGI